MTDQEDQLLNTDIRNLDEVQLEEHLRLIKERCQFYESQNASMEGLFKRLKLLGDENKLNMCPATKKVFNNIMSTMEDEPVPPEMLKKHNIYLVKLKTCIKHYSCLNETVAESIKELKSQLETTKNSPDVVKDYSQNIQKLQENAKKYESHMLKFQRKCRFLSNPKYNLLDMDSQVNTLRALKEETERLLKELEIYQNLKPSINEAQQQLKDLKEQIKAMKE